MASRPLPLSRSLRPFSRHFLISPSPSQPSISSPQISAPQISAPQISLVWLCQLASLGLKDTLAAARQHFQVGINGENALPNPPHVETLLTGMIWRMCHHQGDLKTPRPSTLKAQQLLVDLLSQGANPTLLCTENIGLGGRRSYGSTLHGAVRSVFVTDLLLAHGVNPNIGTILDPNATDASMHHSVLVNWLEYMAGGKPNTRQNMLQVLQLLVKAGVDCNQPMCNWRYPHATQNLLCSMWNDFYLHSYIEPVLAMGVDPDAPGQDGLCFRTLLQAHEKGKGMPGGRCGSEKVSSKQKVRATAFLSWLDSAYPPAPVRSPVP